MKKLFLSLNIVLLIITSMLLLFDVGNIFVSIFSIIVTCVIFATFKFVHGNILSLGFVFIAYNILMHFGFGVINFLVSNVFAREMYASWTLAFLQSSNYSLAIIISALAFECYTIAWLIGLRNKRPRETSPLEKRCNTEVVENLVCYILGIAMLSGVFLYFCYLFVTDRMSFSMTYTDYRNNVMKGNTLYSWVLVFYPTGLLYVIASSKGRRRAVGIALFTATAFIFLITGNKGEVLYAVLASLGILGYQGRKLNKKLVLFLCVIMFVIIPIVTATRSSGVINGFQLVFASFTDSFLEIGMQIRCLVYSIDGVKNGIYPLMYGYSYLNPICQALGYLILPLRSLPEIPIDLVSSNSSFSGFGFTQVAEGYLNFGIIGSMLVFGLFGYYIGKLEFKRMNTRKLCLIGSVLVILINLSRNTFIFVPGQVTVMLIIYFLVNFMLRIMIRGRR